MEKVYVEIMNEGVTFDCKPTVDDVVQAVIEEYKRCDVEIANILDTISVHGLSITDTVRVYARVYNIIEEDSVIRVGEGRKVTFLND